MAIADPIKQTTPAALKGLRDAGVRIVMLTGDSRTTAAAVGKELGIDEVVAEVFPEDKATIVQRLRTEGRVVAMAGDGVNDAPVLLQVYRQHFRPSARWPKPYVMVGVSVVLADSDDEARRLLTSLRLRFHGLRTVTRGPLPRLVACIEDMLSPQRTSRCE